MLRRVRPFQRQQQQDAGTGDQDATSVERRLTHMEAMIEGLQHSVHRESIRRASQIAELKRDTQPDAVRRDLSRDARRRGI